MPFPALSGKTLIFAATDAHADIVVKALKKAFADAYGEIDDEAVKKITGSVDRVQALIRSFRNDANPKIAVTVDLLTTGIDVPSIINLVFLRRVNSRILYEQMIGRATRPCSEIGKEVFRIFDAVDLYPHLQNLTEMKPVVVNPSIGFEQLVREMIEAKGDEQRTAVREQFAVKLRRQLKKLSQEARDRFEAIAGETPEATLKRLLEGEPGELAPWFVRARWDRSPARLAGRRGGPTFSAHLAPPRSSCSGHARVRGRLKTRRLPRQLCGVRSRQHEHDCRSQTRGPASPRFD